MIFKKRIRLIITLLILSQFYNSYALAISCKKYRSCRQAVVNWCNGSHSGADRDRDGIPCENVCRSKRTVDKIRKEIGCKK